MMTNKLTSAELRSFLPGDVVRLIPLEDDASVYKYYKMPANPTELVLLYMDPFREVLGSPYCVVSLWKQTSPNKDRHDAGEYDLSYSDTADSGTLFFNGESTCETHDYVIELVRRVPDQDAAKSLQASWDILFAAQERRQPAVDFDDVVDTALWREGQRVLGDLRSYMRKRAKEISTGKHYPLHVSRY